MTTDKELLAAIVEITECGGRDILECVRDLTLERNRLREFAALVFGPAPAYDQASVEEFIKAKRLIAEMEARWVAKMEGAKIARDQEMIEALRSRRPMSERYPQGETTHAEAEARLGRQAFAFLYRLVQQYVHDGEVHGTQQQPWAVVKPLWMAAARFLGVAVQMVDSEHVKNADLWWFNDIRELAETITPEWRKEFRAGAKVLPPLPIEPNPYRPENHRYVCQHQGKGSNEKCWGEVRIRNINTGGLTRVPMMLCEGHRTPPHYKPEHCTFPCERANPSEPCWGTLRKIAVPGADGTARACILCEGHQTPGTWQSRPQATVAEPLTLKPEDRPRWPDTVYVRGGGDVRATLRQYVYDSLKDATLIPPAERSDYILRWTRRIPGKDEWDQVIVSRANLTLDGFEWWPVVPPQPVTLY